MPELLAPITTDDELVEKIFMRHPPAQRLSPKLGIRALDNVSGHITAAQISLGVIRLTVPYDIEIGNYLKRKEGKIQRSLERIQHALDDLGTILIGLELEYNGDQHGNESGS